MQAPLASQKKAREEAHQRYAQIFSEQISGLSNDISLEFNQNHADRLKLLDCAIDGALIDTRNAFRAQR